MSTPLSLDARLRNASYALEAAPALPAGEGQLVPMLVSERIQLIIDLREAADALTGRLVPQAWQPIETCPDNGRPVLFAVNDLVWLAPNPRASLAQRKRHWAGPTHWMALPPPPLRPGEPR